MELLSRNVKKVLFFRPLVDADHGAGERDNTLTLIKSQYHLCTSYEEMYAFTVAEASQLIAMGRDAELHEGILNKYNVLAEKADFILCEGIEMIGAVAPFDFEINIAISNNLGCPLIARGRRKNEACRRTHTIGQGLP